MPSNRTSLSNIGEFGLIDKIARGIRIHKDVFQGIGDDTAVISQDKEKYLLFTTDMLVEGRHFTSSDDPRAIGHKALACSLSDIAAMGGLPQYAVVSLGVCPRRKLDFVKEMYKGMLVLAKKFGVSLVGGDTVSFEKWIINVALIGEVKKKYLVLRRGAKKKDMIFITGSLGGSFSTKKHISFMPRIREAQFLVKNFRPTSMIDVSDGLIGDLKHILKASHVGARLFTDKIPRTQGVSLRQALCEGEDFELMFTLNQSQARRFIHSKNIPFSWSCIGEIAEKTKGLSFLDSQAKRLIFTDKSFRHF